MVIIENQNILQRQLEKKFQEQTLTKVRETFIAQFDKFSIANNMIAPSNIHLAFLFSNYSPNINSGSAYFSLFDNLVWFGCLKVAPEFEVLRVRDF